MRQEEFRALVKAMKAVYAQPTFIPDTAAMNVWYELLKDIPYDRASVAIQKHMCTSSFPPTVADIRKNAYEVVTDTTMNDTEAWNIVYKAICNSGYNSEAEFAKLPPLIQKAVGSAAMLKEWSQMEVDTIQSVERSHFARNYRAAVENNTQESQLAPHVKSWIEQNQIKNPQLAEVQPEPRKIESAPGAYDGVPMPEKRKARLTELLFGKKER